MGEAPANYCPQRPEATGPCARDAEQGQSVAYVWIEPGCTRCGVCEAMCPEVFGSGTDTYIVRPEAGDAAFVGLRSRAIIEAARACLPEVIRLRAVWSGPPGSAVESQGSVVEPPAAGKVGRRGVITAAGVGGLALVGSATLAGLAVQRFMFPNVREGDDPRLAVGELAGYAGMSVGSVAEDHKNAGVWIVRLAGGIAALSTECPHLGCTLNWVPQERAFKCPCHGSGFTPEGFNREGPAPRPMERFALAVEDGTIIVDRSRRLRHEKGEWDRPESFVGIASRP